MLNNLQRVQLLTAVALIGIPLLGAEAKEVASRAENAVLWQEPKDIQRRNLFYGPGGEKDQPRGPFVFEKEDFNGTNPKFVVRDKEGTKWTVKMGIEARPETVASRLVWAVGYFANEDYFVQDLHVEGMPRHLKRGADQVKPGGVVHAVRMKRHMEDRKKSGNWKWRGEAFQGSRELDGLKVMMALINNWDLKDENNEIYRLKDSKKEIYLASDLGASFGSTGLTFPFSHSKGYYKAYAHSTFIRKITPQYVDFRVPSRPALIYILTIKGFFRRLPLDSIGKHVPREDARWMGHVLAGLSAEQIHDAFRAAGYTPAQIDAYSKVVQSRIDELNRL